VNLAAALLALLLHAGLMLASAPLLAGLLQTARARVAGRAGPPIVQPWREHARLLLKRPVLAEHASFITSGAPGACFAATAAAALLVPSFTLGMASAGAADLLVIVGLLALARIALALVALDAGTALGGLGASRAGLLAMLGEAALVLVALVVALAAGSTNLDRAAAVLRDGGTGARLPLTLAAIATALVTLVEGDRAGGLGTAPSALAAGESAALHELSGCHLALVTLAGQLRRLTLLGLIAALFLPFGLAPEGSGPGSWIAGLVAWMVKIGVLGAIVLLAESWGATLRVAGVAQRLGLAILLALAAAMLLLSGQVTA
jgi:formate hydrogenlyase subunit 4